MTLNKKKKEEKRDDYCKDTVQDMERGEKKKEKAEDASLYDKRREEVKEIRESGAACVKEACMCETGKKKENTEKRDQ